MLQSNLTFSDWLSSNYAISYTDSQEVLNVIYTHRKVRRDIIQTATYMENSKVQTKATITPRVNKAGDINLQVTMYITDIDEWQPLKLEQDKMQEHMKSDKVCYWIKCIDPADYDQLRCKQHGKINGEN